MSWEALKSAVTAVITANGNGEITGQILQDLLNNNIIPLLGAGKFKGVASVNTVPTAAPQSEEIYISSTPGTYANFGGIVVSSKVSFLKYNGTVWARIETNLPFREDITLNGNVTNSRAGNVTTITIDTDNSLAVFDAKGGYRFIKSGSYDIDNNGALFLSASESSYVYPDLVTRGTGQLLYPFVTASYGSSENKYLLGVNWNNWQTKYPILQENFKEYTNNRFQITSSLKVLDIRDTAMKIAFQDAGFVLNLFNGTAINIDTSVLNCTNSSSSVVVLSKSATEFIPLSIFDAWSLSDTAYLYEFTAWNNIKNNKNILIVGSPDASGDFFKSYSENLKVINNDFILQANTADINGIREQFYKDLLIFDLFLETDSITIQELTLDSISVPHPTTAGTEIIFGAFANPQNIADKGIYSQVAKATMMVSPNNYNFIDWKIEPLNGSFVKGYMQTKRSFFNYFYVSGNPNDWSSTNGTDAFMHFNLSKLKVINLTSSIDSNLELENKGLLPHRTYNSNPLNLEVLNKVKEKKGDVTIVLLGDSISTNGLYASDSLDAPYNPPRMDEEYYVKLLEENLRWKGQEYRRYDAFTEKGGAINMFTEVATTKTSKLSDAAWDWQPPNDVSIYYNVPTRVLEGTNASVSFVIPAGNKQASFIYRTDYLNANNAVVTISTGNGKVKVKENGGNVEANNYSFIAKEVDNIITTARGDLRKSQAQKRLIFRFDDITSDITITITNNGAGRLNYWGVEYSPNEFMFRLINNARGGHSIDRIEFFESWDLDAYEPDAVFLQTCIINEAAMSLPTSSTNTPLAFATRFDNYVTKLKNKSYMPEIIPFVLYIGVQANIVDQATGKYNSGYVGNESVDTYKYIGALDEALTANVTHFINLFNSFDEIAHRKAKIEETDNIWLSALQGSGKTGSTFTRDNVHFNDYGSLIAFRLLKQYLNI